MLGGKYLVLQQVELQDVTGCKCGIVPKQLVAEAGECMILLHRGLMPKAGAWNGIGAVCTNMFQQKISLMTMHFFHYELGEVLMLVGDR